MQLIAFKPGIYRVTASAEGYLRACTVFFHTAHKHPSRYVDLTFEVYNLWPTFSPSMTKMVKELVALYPNSCFQEHTECAFWGSWSLINFSTFLSQNSFHDQLINNSTIYRAHLWYLLGIHLVFHTPSPRGCMPRCGFLCFSITREGWGWWWPLTSSLTWNQHYKIKRLLIHLNGIILIFSTVVFYILLLSKYLMPEVNFSVVQAI